MRNPCNNCARVIIGCIPSKQCKESQVYRKYRVDKMPKIIHRGSKDVKAHS